MRRFPRVLLIAAALSLAGCSGTMDMFKPKDGAIQSGALDSPAKSHDSQPVEATEAMADSATRHSDANTILRANFAVR